jgi:hypothetical protein
MMMILLRAPTWLRDTGKGSDTKHGCERERIIGRARLSMCARPANAHTCGRTVGRKHSRGSIANRFSMLTVIRF